MIFPPGSATAFLSGVAIFSGVVMLIALVRGDAEEVRESAFALGFSAFLILLLANP